MVGEQTFHRLAKPWNLWFETKIDGRYDRQGRKRKRKLSDEHSAYSHTITRRSITERKELIKTTRYLLSRPREITSCSFFKWAMIVKFRRVSKASQLSLRNSRLRQSLHPWVRVDQACRPLSPKTLSILVGLTFKLVSLCSHYRNILVVA